MLALRLIALLENKLDLSGTTELFLSPRNSPQCLFMNFLVEICLLTSIICVLYLRSRLINLQKSQEDVKINADSLENLNLNLKNQIEEQKASYTSRETNLYKTISGLQESLSLEQEGIKARDLELRAKEKSLKESLEATEKNLEEETESRKKVLSQKKSSEVRLGHIAETLAPFLDQFDFDPENCVFLGKPIDYISFDDDAVTLIEVKSGKSQLNSKQRHIRDLIKSNQVNWKEIRIK